MLMTTGLISQNPRKNWPFSCIYFLTNSADKQKKNNDVSYLSWFLQSLDPYPDVDNTSTIGSSDCFYKQWDPSLSAWEELV